jgi:oligo-1,6-glucosidase
MMPWKPSLNSLLALAVALLSVAVAAFGQAASPNSPGDKLINGYEQRWWKEAVVYQVYPRSFKDSNGDGIGDLPGITSKLDYLQKLGVNVIWLSPHFDSPNADNGYDIRDYRKVMAEFGTMEDFSTMLAGIKKRHMRLIIDLVVNHTSDEHHWFAESRKSKDNPYRDYYIWRDGKPDSNAPSGFDPPNNYPSYFSGSAWQFDPATKQFYLHLFAVKQPDLNWDNPKVRGEVFSLMKFWLDKGVDGFRMDVIPLISKPEGLADLTTEELTNPSAILANGPHRDEYLQQMNKEVLSHYDVMTVGEAIGINLANEPKIVDDRRHELNMIFNFDAVRIDRTSSQWRDWALPELKAIYDAHATSLDKHSWDTVFLGNHDNPRVVSSFGDDSTPEFRKRSAKLLATMLLTLRGTPFLYQGDELGMTNYPFKDMKGFEDIEVKNAYRANVATGKISEADFIANLRRTSRDNARTPMQWSRAANAGFTSGKEPWLAINPNYATINAAQELADPGSIYHFTQKIIALHHAHPAFVYGDYKDLAPSNGQIYAYTRSLGAEHFLVVLNFSKTNTSFKLPEGMKAGALLLGNIISKGTSGNELTLAPWEARVYRF